MKKVIAWLLVLALTAAVSIGATLAYLTDTDEDVNVMTLGKVKIDQLEYERVDVESKDDKAEVQEFHDNKPLLPAVTDKSFDYTPGTSYVDWEQIGKDGYTSDIWNPELINNEVDKMVFIKNKGDYDAYVRSVFAFEAGKYTTLDEFKSMVHLNLNTTDYTWEWVETPVAIPNEDGSATTNYFVATATYNKVLAPGALTEISLSQIALDKTATNEDVEAFGDTYQVLVKSQGIQADGFDRPDAALNEGFGIIDADNIPWENDSPTRGVSLKKALHYYEGGATKITGNVANVIFGKTADYPEVVNSDSGTLVDVEQDVPARAYYVSNGSTYDVYVLSDSTIYAPANSKSLFASMSSLKTVKGDLDVSRVTTMESMFDYCSALQSVDSKNWKQSKNTNMAYMFYGCKALTDLDTSGWDLSSVTTMNQTFYNCSSLKTLDVSDWNVGNVDFFYYAFSGCSGLTYLDVSQWDVSKVTNFYSMFQGCTSLNGLDVSEWNVSSATEMKNMFYNCKSLTALDVANWDTSNVKSMAQMFLYCSSLTEMDMSKWDVSNVTSFHGMFGFSSKLRTVKTDSWNPVSATSFVSMFHDCVNLQGFNAKNWKMPELLTTSHMFRGCTSASSIDVSGWYTPKLTSIDGMFHTCKELTTIDVSSFDTSKCEEISQVFEHCYKLEEIVGLGNWNTESCRTFEECFSSCYALKVLDMSGFNTRLVEDAFYPMQNGSTGNGFKNMLPNMRSLEKMILSADFSFDGDGKVTTADKKVILPSPAAKEGYIGKWQNVETGVVYDASEIPEETAATYVAYYEYASKGATMKDALHYLNANPSGTKITANVTNVIFGRNDDYADIVNNYTGVLADQEQDGPVYAYYVPNGSYYDIYVLSDDVIYTPENSTELFFKMENLVTVDTSNLDVSRTTDMTDMFYRCYKLENIDVSEWDTSNVTSMVGVFARCYVLTNVDVSGWDTGNSKLFNSMFSDCYKLNLDKNALANWDMSSAVRINHMFYACSAQEELNLSGWNMPNMITTTHMFADCNSLRSVDFTGWNTPSMVSMDALFNDCHSLTYLDVSSFDTANCNEFTQVFESCKNLKTIVGLDKWDTGNARTYEELFSGCAVLKEVDLSTFKSRDVVNDFTMEWKGTGWGFLRMFSGMNSLEKMTLSADFSFDGDGKVTTESYKVSLPSPAAKEGFTAKWKNVDTGVLYDASEIPEEVAATYVAHYTPNP